MVGLFLVLSSLLLSSKQAGLHIESGKLHTYLPFPRWNLPLAFPGVFVDLFEEPSLEP